MSNPFRYPQLIREQSTDKTEKVIIKTKWKARDTEIGWKRTSTI